MNTPQQENVFYSDLGAFRLKISLTDECLSIDGKSENRRCLAKVCNNDVLTITKSLFMDIDALYVNLVYALGGPHDDARVEITPEGKLKYTCQMKIGKTQSERDFSLDLSFTDEEPENEEEARIVRLEEQVKELRDQLAMAMRKNDRIDQLEAQFERFKESTLEKEAIKDERINELNTQLEKLQFEILEKDKEKTEKPLEDEKEQAMFSELKSKIDYLEKKVIDLHKAQDISFDFAKKTEDLESKISELTKLQSLGGKISNIIKAFDVLVVRLVQFEGHERKGVFREGDSNYHPIKYLNDYLKVDNASEIAKIELDIKGVEASLEKVNEQIEAFENLKRTGININEDSRYTDIINQKTNLETQIASLNQDVKNIQSTKERMCAENPWLGFFVPLLSE